MLTLYINNRYKFTQKGGRSEHCRGFAHGVIKGYYEGMCGFFKLYLPFKGSFMSLCEAPVPYKLYLLRRDSRCEQCSNGVWYDTATIAAMACVPIDSTVMDGIQTLNFTTFCEKGNDVGGSLAF